MSFNTRFPMHRLALVAATLLTSVASSNVWACQPGDQKISPYGNQYRAFKKRMPLSAFLNGVPKSEAKAATEGRAADPSITGLWQTVLVEGDMAEDGGFEQFNMGGTHLLNDPSPILAGNVCLGAWTQTAPLTYVVNHPSYIYDDKGEEVIGMVSIYAKIVLDASGNTFHEEVKVVARDLEGNILGTFAGHKMGKRVIADDTPFR